MGILHLISVHICTILVDSLPFKSVYLHIHNCLIIYTSILNQTAKGQKKETYNVSSFPIIFLCNTEQTIEGNKDKSNQRLQQRQHEYIII